MWQIGRWIDEPPDDPDDSEEFEPDDFEYEPDEEVDEDGSFRTKNRARIAPECHQTLRLPLTC